MAQVTAADFAILKEACDALDAAGVPYVIGGGTAVVQWGRERRTKDFDIFLNRDVLRRTMDTLSLQNFMVTDTEKSWLYKAWRGETLVDIIVESRGHVNVDDDVISHARMVNLHGHDLRLMGPEDTLFRKALTLTEGRPDWYDGISIIERQGDNLDWTYFTYLAQRHPRRILSFLLFTQTEVHLPPTVSRSQVFQELFPGHNPGPVPEWVVFALVRQIWLQGAGSPRNPRTLKHFPRAA